MNYLNLLPPELILHLADYFKLADYKRLIKAIYPRKGSEGKAIRNKIWLMSCRKMEASFFNGKKLNIRYNFDALRSKPNRILVNVDDVLPILGNVMPPASELFPEKSRLKKRYISLEKLKHFVQMHVHLNLCDYYSHAECPCHLIMNEEMYNDFKETRLSRAPSNCKHMHFQHYCWNHVHAWFHQYLELCILLKESKVHFNEAIEEMYGDSTDRFYLFQTGERATEEYFLKSAYDYDTIDLVGIEDPIIIRQ